MRQFLLFMLFAVFLSACTTGYQRRGEYPSYYSGASWECHRIAGSGWDPHTLPTCDAYPRWQR
jgi:hypothetical protein